MSAKSIVPELDSWLAPRWSRGGTALARSTQTTTARRSSLLPAAPVAIRVPERMVGVVFPSASPQLFVHEGARQALERRLKAACPGRLVVLSITDNRHSIISHAFKGGILHARIHHMFLDAPPRVIEALVRYVVNDDREASLLVGQYIEANGARLARRRARAIPLHAKGTHHDLLAIFNDLNERYFDGGCHALITWGRRTKRKGNKPRHAIRLGSYASLERLIRIHPVLDRSWVPRYFVAYVVYHEMLHHMIPSARGNGNARQASLAAAMGTGVSRRVLHPPEFLERERDFRNYERALEWERRHIGRVLRASG
jgi:hypothetical protein